MCFYTRQAKAEHYVYQLILTLPPTDMLSNTLALSHTHTLTYKHRRPLRPSERFGCVAHSIESTLVRSHTPNPFPSRTLFSLFGLQAPNDKRMVKENDL